MSWIRLNNVAKDYERNVVLREAFFKLGAGDRVGLIGRNGTGKTTLLELILERDVPTSGTVDISHGVTIGYFSQFSELSGNHSVWETLNQVFAEIHDVEQRLEEVNAALGSVTDTDEMTKLIDEQGTLFEQMETLGGWTYENKIETVLSKLGFDKTRRQLPVDQLSGGWRNRAALALILLQQPDVLLLDEPTNFLDLDGVRWIENWLESFPGAALIVSHDRQFLDNAVTRIVEIENHHLHEYDGNYSYYVPKKQSRIKTLERQFVHEEELLAYEGQAIDKRQRAAQRKGVDRKIANIKKRKTPKAVDQVITNIYDHLHISDDLCRVENISMAYGENVLFEDLSFELHRRDRLAIVGSNGSGKTTLLDVLVGKTTPTSGSIRWVKGANFAYYNSVFESLDLDDTVAHSINSAPGSLAFAAPKKHVNRFLTLLQFSEMDLKQRIGDLSGGQRARVALAHCLLSGASVIILDEPTNHLDILSAQVMDRALAHFPGAVVVVSHDRFFIDKLAKRLLVFDGSPIVKRSASTGAI
ncbi:MAG: ABC-F family ATP-binding cassette domain-containing protein [Acidimicrobiales bacterium]